nr:VWA domain-containing protein [uncultured Trichococcus sp.]
MNFKRMVSIGALLTLTFLGICSNNGTAAAEIGTSEKIAVSLVIDTSGSMAETDPTNLRKTAADVFVDMLSPEDYVGIVSFSTDVMELAPMQQVGDATNKQNIKASLAPIVNANGNTNYQLALQKAEQQLDSYTEENVKKVIIFLTDGVPEPDYALREDAAFMSAYMESLWQTTAQIGLKNYSVYALGFGSADPSALQRIASDTRGEAKFLGNSSEIAVNFFEILRTLKNRQGFWNEMVNVANETVMPFQVDGYDSQVTMVLTYDTVGMDAWVRSVDELDSTGKVNIQKNENYTIITLNQSDKELAGNWELVLNGNGNAQLFGDKDLSLKSWLLEPKANTQQPLGEPLRLSVSVTGAVSDTISVAVLVSKNGNAEAETVLLEQVDGGYEGIYDNVDETGNYLLETQIREGNSVIASNTAAISVLQLPSLASDAALDKGIFKLSETQFVTGYLELGDGPLANVPDLIISSFSLITTGADGQQEIHPLLDWSSESSGDAFNGDSIYSVPLSIAEEGLFEADLVVQGTYQGANFTLEKPLGEYKVISGGVISGTFGDEEIINKPGGEVTIPAIIKNQSGRTETVHVSLTTEQEVSEEQVLTMKAGEQIETNFIVSLASDAPLEKQAVSMEIAAEDPLTQVEIGKSTSIAVISGNEFFVRNLLIFLTENSMLIVVLLSLPVLIYLTGRILYAVKLNKALQVNRYLVYERIGSVAEAQQLLLPKKPGKISLVFGADSEEADVVLIGPKIPYLLVVEVAIKYPKWRWLEGYRVLSKAYLPIHITVTTTPPGIFKLDSEVHTQKEIFDQDSFESGGYRFRYQAEKAIPEENKAKNLLEGKM